MTRLTPAEREAAFAQMEAKRRPLTDYGAALAETYADPPPGVRYVRGRPYTYDMDALKDWLAVEAKRSAPDDLAGLSDADLTVLFYRAIRLDALSGGRDPDLMRRVDAERSRRGLNAAFLDDSTEAA